VRTALGVLVDADYFKAIPVDTSAVRLKLHYHFMFLQILHLLQQRPIA